MDRQGVTINKNTKIINDSNDYSNLHAKNPKYSLELFQKIITVSLETQKIVKDLPEIEI